MLDWLKNIFKKKEIPNIPIEESSEDLDVEEDGQLPDLPEKEFPEEDEIKEEETKEE